MGIRTGFSILGFQVIRFGWFIIKLNQFSHKHVLDPLIPSFSIFNMPLSILALLLACALAFPTAERGNEIKPRSFKIPIHRRDLGTTVAYGGRAFWTVPIRIGDQQFPMLLDTGSSDL